MHGCPTLCSEGSMHRLCRALLNCKSGQDRGIAAFLDGVDVMTCHGAGAYLRNKLEVYGEDAKLFATTEGVDYERLRAFLLLFGDIKLNVVLDLDSILYGRSESGDQPPTAKSMIGQNDAGALELLNCLEDTRLRLIAPQQQQQKILFGIIVKFALYYARDSSAVIPESLQLI